MSNTNPSTVWVNGERPRLGDTATSRQVGRSGRALHVWEACSGCGKERWIKRNTSGTLCKSCALRKHAIGEQNNRWNPSRKTITKSGIRVYIDADHPYFCMAHRCATNGYAVLEHRLVMAEFLKRPLEKWEVVHHIDGNNTNNELSNLLLLPSQAYHAPYTLLQTQIRRVEEELERTRGRVAVLEAENVLLHFQLSAQGTGNPELSGEAVAPPKCVETIDHPSHEDEEIVHPSRKLGDEGA